MFNKTEKRIRKEAREMLPDIKQKIRSEVFPENDVGIGAAKSDVLVASGKRNILIAAVAFVFLLITGISLLINIYGGGFPASENYLRIDVNPSFEIISGDDGIVKEVKALNKEAVLVLYGNDLKGKTNEQAIETILKSTINLGYLDKNSGEMKLIAVGDTQDKENLLTENTKRTVSGFLSLNHINSTVHWINDDSKKDRAEELGVSVGKLELMLEAGETCGITLEDAKKLTPAELTKLIKNYDDDNLKNFFSELDKKYVTADMTGVESARNDRLEKNNKIIDKIESLLEYIDENEENESEIERAVSRFNILYPEYKFDGNVKDTEALEKHFEEKTDILEKEIDDMEDEFEKALDEIKKIWKNELDD